MGPFSVMLGRLPVGRPLPDAYGPESEAEGRGDVSIEAVADHDGIFRSAVQSVQGFAKDAFIRLGYTHFAGEKDSPEVALQAVPLKPTAGSRLGVAYQREWTEDGQPFQGCVDIQCGLIETVSPRVDAIPELSCEAPVATNKLKSPRPDVGWSFFDGLPKRTAKCCPGDTSAISAKGDNGEGDPAASRRPLVQNDAA